MVRICFVTNEMHPISPGGIGRLMYNFAIENVKKKYQADIHYLFPDTESKNRAQLQTCMNGLAQVHFCSGTDIPQDHFGQALSFIRADDWNFERGYLLSLHYMFGLQRLQIELGEPFDIIEFPDFGGWAFATLQAKSSGLDFLNSHITVRLHSTLGLISRYERFYHAASEHAGALCDQERYCLENSDLVISHLKTISGKNALHYGFNNEWLQKLRIEFPPIILDEETSPDIPAEIDGPVFVFSSRLQPFKRPDVFINAGVRFLRLNRSSPANFLLISYGWDENYISYLAALIPAEFSSRIIMQRNLTLAERRRVLAQSIVVIPSDYESLCLFAYEAALLGRPVILNRQCDAFGNCDRWDSGKNCLFFENDFVGLSEIMLQAISWHPSKAVNAVADIPYWISQKALIPDTTEPAALSARIVALPDGDTKSFSDFCFRLSRTRMESVAVTMMLPDTQLTQGAKFSALIASFGWKAMFYSGIKIRPAEVQYFIEHLTEDILIFLPQAFDFYPNFVKIGLQCMARNPNLAIFTTHVCLADDEGFVNGLSLFAGQLPSVALLRASVCPAACLVRRSAILAYPFDERARDSWFETFCRQIVLKGSKVLVAPMAAILGHVTPAMKHSNKIIDATMRDDLGLASGVVPRLLFIEAVAGFETWQDNPSLVLAGRDLSEMRRILPAEIETDWEPVCFKEDLGAILIHPLQNSIVVGHLQFKLPIKPNKIECIIRNAHTDNMGFEMAASLQPAPLSDMVFEAGMNGWSDWHFIPAKTVFTVNLPIASLQRGPCHLYIATRLRPGTNNFFTWAVLDSINVY